MSDQSDVTDAGPVGSDGIGGPDESDEEPLWARVAASPLPALAWFAGALLLVSVEFGALLRLLVALGEVVLRVLPGVTQEALSGAESFARSFPTLLSRDVIPNEGWKVGPDGPWRGTFMGMEPKYAWLTRVVLVYAYSFVWLGWLAAGYGVYRRFYRYADWTPRDDVVGRLRGHYWGQFGFLVVFMFLVLATFAPALGPTTLDQNIYNPYDHEIRYFDQETEQVETIVVGLANIQSSSKGGSQNVGPWTYDDFGRFHPFGTLVSGKDLFTFMAEGARISLAIGVGAMVMAAFLGMLMAMVTAYYKGLVDLLVVLTSDSVQALPLLMVLILVVTVFQGTWLSEFYDGALLLTLVLGTVYWPYLWRAVRGPALQVAEQEWVDAAQSYGQTPTAIMRKHMMPYIVGYMMIYASLSLGGVIIAVAGLTFLSLGITPPTPEWGRAIDIGQPYVATSSWHISLIPGILITLVVTAFNAFGDGVRDAIDPQSEGVGADAEATAGGGGA